ncbi:HYR domain-containing protein [Rasiella rasia]|uniref:HYR domain-containing protein n=1 Tax=Rasiella rasia TaxID=2744027 RepID=A0A6G6GHV5_9FLAO|nr:HYR domain-containing protein [Rasiella rasia]QIE58097.1 HYR domain-containing protein [Rasiella rasia]
MKKIIIALLCLAMPFMVFAQNASYDMFDYVNSRKGKATTFASFQLFNQNSANRSTAYANAVEDGVVLDFNASTIQAIYEDNPRTMNISVPLKSDGSTVQLELVQKDIFSDDFRVRTSDGRDITNEIDRGKHFRGIIAGDANSLVSISIFRNEIIGFVANNEGNFVIGKIKGQTSQHIIYNDRNLMITNEFNCTTEDDGVGYTMEELTPQAANRDAGDCVNIYIEAGQSVYNAFGGNLTNTMNFLNGVFAQSYVLYANDGMALQTSDMLIWTTPDPYSGPSAANYRAQFQSNTGPGAFNGDLGHLVEVDNVGGQAAGFSGLCNANTDESLCFSGFSSTNYNNVPTYSFNVTIITHEMGHLMGSRHTHACVWNGNSTAIDGCAGFTEGTCAIPPSANPGTIMSYCTPNISFTEGFHPQPTAVMQNNVNAIGNCLTTCAAPATNDFCADAATINYGDTFSGSTTMATFDNVGFCGTSNTAPGVWYTFVGNGNFTRLTTCNQANYDTKISVFTGSCGALVCETGVDDAAGCAGFTTELDFCTTNGTTYLVLIHGFSNAIGDFDLSLVDLGNTAPVITCPADITMNNDPGDCGAIVNFSATATDDCGSTITYSQDSGTVFPVGTTVVTATATDGAGLTDSCTFNVTINDTESPTAVCQDITIQLDANGDASIVAADVDGGSTDACGIASIAVDIDTFDCSNVGPNNVTLTVTDVNGNTSSCVAVVTVEDNIAPMIFCPADIVAPTNNGECGATVTFPLPVGTDNCGIDFVVQQAGIASGEIFPIGVTTNQFIVVDVNGNTATCSFTVTVTDDDPPMAVCQDITVMLDATGNATIVAADVDGGSTDNCAITSLSIDIDSFTCADLGDNIVTLTATDAGGLSSSCTAIVTVENGVMPNAVCQDASVQLDALGMVSIIDASIFDGGSTDACGGTNLTFSVSPDTFTCADVGDNTVTITVTDDGGNTSTCTATLTVEDVMAPTVSCMDLTVSLDANGEASIDSADLVVMSDDICGIAQTSADITDFNCDDVGTPVVVTVTVEDPSGNTATCTATVTVLDEIAPELDCPVDFTVQTIEGTQYEVENFITSGAVTATDNCTDPVNVVSQSPAVGDLLDPGVYPVTITVSDASGNEADCTFNLTVEAVLGIGDNSFDISSVSMYPNPATDFVMLSNPQHIPLQDVRIYDVTGRLIKTIDARETLSEMSIDISELASATYLFLVNTENGEQLTHQIVKE